MTTKYEAMREALERFIEDANDYGSYGVKTYDSARAALAMPDDPTPEESSVVVPGGWKLVPVDPSREMLDAAHTDFRRDVEIDQILKTSYRAMLTAAPQLFGKTEQVDKQPAQELTDDEIDSVSEYGGFFDCLCDPYDALKNGNPYSSIQLDLRRFARAIEARLKC